MPEEVAVHSVIDTVTARCMAHHIVRPPKKIYIEIGTLSHYTKEGFEHYFDELKHDNPFLRNTKLHVSIKQGKLTCKECGKHSILHNDEHGVCHHCHSHKTEVTEGKGFKIEKIKY